MTEHQRLFLVQARLAIEVYKLLTVKDIDHSVTSLKFFLMVASVFGRG